MARRVGNGDDAKRLLVILPDRVSEWSEKGEITPRYLNPGDIFDEIHVCLTNDDEPPRHALQKMAGRAQVELHHLPDERRVFLGTIGYRDVLLREWRRNVLRLGRRVRPHLVRCHGARLNALAAETLQRALGAPYVVSLHINPDIDYRRADRPLLRRLAARRMRALETRVLRSADLVLPVYEAILPYLRSIGVERYDVAYNVVGTGLVMRERGERNAPGTLRVLTVSRQMRGHKDPRPIIEAAAALPFVRLHVVGDGDLHDEISRLVGALGARDRIRLSRALPNEDVLEAMADHDVYAYASSYYELSKSVMEAALAGLPLVVSNRGGDPAPELAGGPALLVDGSVDSFRRAFSVLHEHDDERARRGHAAADWARARWDPDRAEECVAAHYRRLLMRAPRW